MDVTPEQIDRMDRVYTERIIEEAWGDYITKKVLKLLVDGKWKYRLVEEQVSRGAVNATKAEVVTINKVMGFPKFLKKYYG